MNQKDAIRNLLKTGKGFDASHLHGRHSWPQHQNKNTGEVLANLSAEIFSYWTRIAFISHSDKKVYVSSRKYSKTTSKQSGYIRRISIEAGFEVVTVECANDFQPLEV